MLDLTDFGKKAAAARRILSVSSTEQRDRALSTIASSVSENIDYIISENMKDIENGKASGLSEALLDRLALNADRINGICSGILEIKSLCDPVGNVLAARRLENGLLLEKVSVPIGTIAVIFEARPNVTADSAALCLKSGNAVILRGGKEAILSNTALCTVMRDALARTDLPKDSIQLIEDTTRDSAFALMTLNRYIDLLIPRGGAGLINSVISNATVPVIETGAGTCHIYIDKDADLDMAASIVFNAKTSRPSVCNACECILVHKDIATEFLPKAKSLLDTKGVELRADKTAKVILPDAFDASPNDWGREYNDFILACRVVDSVNEAIDHITEYGTRHSEAIVTEDHDTAAYFLNSVDAAAVYHNASTRFTDGNVFGLGAEIGISTQKLHARGPIGLAELTSYKYKIFGSGQVR